MEHAKIERINALARKQKSEASLTEEEKLEQAELRREYISEIRASFGATLESTVIVRPDGTREPVSDRKKIPGMPAEMKKKDTSKGGTRK